MLLTHKQAEQLFEPVVRGFAAHRKRIEWLEQNLLKTAELIDKLSTIVVAQDERIKELEYTD